MNIDQVGYGLKRRFPFLFQILECILGYAVYGFHRRAITEALKRASIEGTVLGESASIRPVDAGNLGQLLRFFGTLPEGSFTYFRPHGFERCELKKVLARPYFVTYGLFVGDELKGYCLLKLYPGRKAFLGRIVGEDLTGFGLGKFFSRYLRWQAALMGFRLRSTISEANLASMQSHKSVGGVEIIGDLPNGYKLIEFAVADPGSPPELRIEGKRTSP